MILALAGCNEKEGVTFVKNPDKEGESLTPPAWAAIARSDIQSGLAMSLFSATCKLLYRDELWFVGCRPKKEEASFMLYSIRQDKASNESSVVTALNDQAKQYAHQNLMLRQIIIADTQHAAPHPERLKQDFEAQSGI
ncbi:hypothetical protein COO59_17845 [Mixta theicola]|uniref:Uncharacterized protein n=2 Tax=Mixta theicola TaxID=1458355 RepID=A0A2K1Q5K5_9GAMM|nr:hypothetical protein COO59_17845 [Mixta theicola]